MKYFYFLITIVLIFISCSSSNSKNEIYTCIDPIIQKEIEIMDYEFFQAYNTCNIEKQAEIYDDNLEFFHDKDGLMTSKKEILEGTQKNICGKVTRILIPNSIEVYPIKDYGAVEIGYHRFYNNQEPDAPSRASKFIIIWKKVTNSWKISKVISLH